MSGYSEFRMFADRFLAIFLLICVAAGYCNSAAASAVEALSTSKSNGSWFVDRSTVRMGPKGRYMESLNLRNNSPDPVYVQVSVEEVVIEGGERKRVKVEDGALSVLPSQILLQPNGGGFSARLVGKADMSDIKSRSFYVKFADVSNLQAGENAPNGLQSGMLLAFETLVNIVKTEPEKLTTGKLQLSYDGNRYSLTNLSGQHIYIDKLSGVCPSADVKLTECIPLKQMAVQSVLPGESIVLGLGAKLVGSEVVGLHVFAGLNLGDPSSVLYLKDINPISD